MTMTPKHPFYIVESLIATSEAYPLRLRVLLRVLCKRQTFNILNDLIILI